MSLPQAQITEVRTAIEDLINAYIQCLDDNKLEEWPEFFTDDCVYKVISHENYSRNLPVALIFCNSKGMLRDRVTSHRHANIYEPHKYTHLVSNISIIGQEGDAYIVRSNYAVFQTRQEGTTEVYNVGKYLDKVVFIDGQPKFKEKLAIFDTALVPTLLVTPI